MRARTSSLVSSSVLALLVGCGPLAGCTLITDFDESKLNEAGVIEDAEPETSVIDSGPARDSGIDTGAVIDSGLDTGVEIDSTVDSGADETGDADLDSGDTGLEDTGLEDTGPEDTGLEDTGPEDTGSEDTLDASDSADATDGDAAEDGDAEPSCSSASECPGVDTECVQRTCTSGVCGFSLTPAGTVLSTQLAGDCKRRECDALGNVVLVNDDLDVQADSNQCTDDVCLGGVPSHPRRAAGSSCTQGGGSYCNGAGACVGCIVDADCPGINDECQSPKCNAGTCSVSYTASGTAVAAQTAGDCKQAVCDGNGNITAINDDADVPNDANQCTTDACVSGAPAHAPLSVGSACSQGGGNYCDASGTCAVATCTDSIHNGAETDTDCGGGACVACPPSAACVANTDCDSGVCAMNICAAPSCVDGVQNGTESGVDCGGTCAACPTLLFLGGGSSSSYGGRYDLTTATWTTTALGGFTVNEPALTLTPSGDAVGLIRFTQLGDPNDNQLQYTTWSGGTWSAFAAVGSGVTTQAAPTIAATATGVHAAFLGLDFRNYYTAFAAGAWTTAEDTARFGGTGPSIATTSGNGTLAYVKGIENNLATSVRAAGVWSAEEVLGSSGSTNPTISPTVVAMTGGPVEALVASVAMDASKIRYAIRISGVWSPVLDVPSATTPARIALAPLDGGNAVLAFRGGDSNLYVSFFTGGTWSSPAKVADGITGSPALARGVGGATVELSYVAAGAAHHVRYVSGAWSTPTTIATAPLSGVALASNR